MQWSKLKARIKALICAELRDRIDFHVTRYREATDFGTEAWITLDGQKIFGAGHYHRFVPECMELHRRVPNINNLPHPRPDLRPIRQEIEEMLDEQEIHHTDQLVGAMRSYLDLPVRDALQSGNPFLKALAIIDRRLGNRTLEKLEIEESEHSLVQEFYKLRLAATHISQRHAPDAPIAE